MKKSKIRKMHPASCCAALNSAVTFQCPDHETPFDCPDAVLLQRSDGTFGLIIHDGGTATIAIQFCPWCGTDFSVLKASLPIRKNVQIIDDADNATFSVFQCDEDDFATLFPAAGQDIEFMDKTHSDADRGPASDVLARLWQNPILKSKALGIHGTLYFDADRRRAYLPATKREVDWDAGSINPAQRNLFQRERTKIE